MDNKRTRKIIIVVIVAIAAIIFAQGLFYVRVYFEKRVNHDKVIKLINEDLSFSWDTMDDELQKINEWIDRGYFTNEDKGRLYERASLIYMQKGETMAYYRYLGYALYYLERSSEKDYTINVYLDLANFFLNNYAYDSAEQMMTAAANIKSFEDIDSLQIKSYAFRMMGIMAILDESYGDAEDYLAISQEAVDNSHTNVYEECYTAINDTWLARVYYETGRNEECDQLLSKWEGHEMFTTDVYREIFLRDLIIPYYQVKLFNSMAKELNDNSDGNEAEEKRKEQKVFAAYEEFKDICEENGYEKTELNTLLKMQQDFPPATENAREMMIKDLSRLYVKLFNEQNISYADVIDSTVTDSKSEMENQELANMNYTIRTRATVVGFIVFFLVLLYLVVLALNGRIDGATGLLNRKAFNTMISRVGKRSSEYGIIMVDIDHFKNINDTYGHQNGDVVLERMGHLLRAESNSDVHCFRYGGEEFVMILERGAVSRAEAIAERLRYAMQLQKWAFDEDITITVSCGVASGSREKDVLKTADENLYHSKENGRNRVTFL